MSSIQPAIVSEFVLVDSSPAQLAEIQQPKDAAEAELTIEGRRYPLRQRKASSRYLASEYILEAMLDVHRSGWYSDVQDEINSFHENHIYDLMELPEGKRALRNKGVLKLKIGEDGCPPRYKARKMVNGLQ